MNNRRLRLLACGILLVAVSLAWGSAAIAAPSLQWNSDSVYFDNRGILYIEGYFYNNGTHTITWVNWHQVDVYFRQNNTNWWHHTAATFRDINLYLYPGESKRWTFRIHNVDPAYFDFWRVTWNVNYNYNR